MNFSFISKSASGKIFYLMVLGFYTHDLCKNAKNRISMSFLSQTLCETAVNGDNVLFCSQDPLQFGYSGGYCSPYHTPVRLE